MTDKLLTDIGEIFPLTPCEAPEFDSFHLDLMKCIAKGYDAEGLGRVSLMTGSGLVGLMSMTTLIVNPIEIDAPLFNVDLIRVPGKEMLYMELYDTLLNARRNEAPFADLRAEYADIEDIPGKPHWYDDIRYGASVTKAAAGDQKERLHELVSRYAGMYLDLLKDARRCDAAAKKAKADAYRDGLLMSGGPATDAFLKAWRPEKTGAFFREVLFG